MAAPVGPATTARTVLDRSTSEDDLLVMIVELAQLAGWQLHHDRRSDKALQQGDAGFPDLVLAGHGRIIYVELKNERGRLRPTQERWRDALLAAGADWRLWRPSDWREIEVTLTS